MGLRKRCLVSLALLVVLGAVGLVFAAWLAAQRDPVTHENFERLLVGMSEAEVMRLQLLAESGEVEEAPGQLTSLLDRAYLADSFFEEHVLQDPACLRSPALFREAWAVAQALADFYQRVGQEVGKEPLAGAATGNTAGANL